MNTRITTLSLGLLLLTAAYAAPPVSPQLRLTPSEELDSLPAHDVRVQALRESPAFGPPGDVQATQHRRVLTPSA